MQLPRGKFREIVRGVPLGPLLLELNEVQYTGILKTNWEASSSTLVFQNGLVIMAEYPPYSGDPAWQALSRLGNQSVGGILSDLDPVQLRLVIEFNGPFLLASPATPQKETAGRGKGPAPAGTSLPAPAAGPAPVPPRAAMPAVQDAAGAGHPSIVAGAPAVPAPGATAGQGGTPVPSRDAATAARAMAVLSGESREGGVAGVGASPGGMDPATLATLEMEALDDVDVDHIANKVRKNARGIVKKLHLGHLMTEKDE